MMETFGPLVSIGIMTYNFEKYIDRCIESVIGQDYKNTEIIVVDDASTDATQLKILQHFPYLTTAPTALVILHETNSGDAARSTNDIIKNARGKYTLIFSGDDYLQSNYISTCVEYMEAHPDIDHVVTDMHVVDADKEIIIDTWHAAHYDNDEVITKVFNSYGSSVIASSGMFKTFFLKKHGYIKYMDIESDAINTLYWLNQGMKWGVLNIPLCYYLQHAGNVSKSIKNRALRVNATLRYIIENFYSTSENKNATYIAFFEKMIASYMSNQFPAYLHVSGISKEQMKIYCQPFYDSISEFKKGLNYAV